MNREQPKAGDGEDGEENESEFIAVGKESQTNRALFTIKSQTIKTDVDKRQVGVYLDTCVAILTIDQPDAFWIFWLAQIDGPREKESVAGVRGHTASGTKTAEEYGKDVLRGFRRDLLAAGFPQRKLHAARSMDEACQILQTHVKMTNQSAENVVAYLRRNKASS